MAKPDPYADIDFEEINEATNLANDEIKCLKVSLRFDENLTNFYQNFIVVVDKRPSTSHNKPIKYLINKYLDFRFALTCLTQRNKIICLLMIWVRS